MKKICIMCCIVGALNMCGCSDIQENTKSNIQKPSVSATKEGLFYKQVDVVVTNVRHITRFCGGTHWQYTEIKVKNEQYNLEHKETLRGRILIKEGDKCQATLYTKMVNDKPVDRYLQELEVNK